VSTERPLRMEHPYASDTTVNNVQVVDVMEAASNFHKLTSPMHGKNAAKHDKAKCGFAPTSI
jgi:hypothetical protein